MQLSDQGHEISDHDVHVELYWHYLYDENEQVFIDHKSLKYLFT